ncbi:nuclear transport factor 2 family protein [Tunicatimonas pelagia]|uniref:nuclear transport factor 2 family protein n=1 Tax=Tunicatimonas pelagia TaxID=931531 RepID=UPI002666C658|nr:nuclear transport factor 2 family protein [Tunicatimonas pelagia]WKN40768.1 nuclear transport factor 2 family protein [Tunicatimonas pelagia]
MNQTADLLDIVQTMERLVGQSDWVAAANYFTPQALYKVADREPVYGIEDIEHYMVWQNSLVQWKGHDMKLVVSQDNALVVEVDSFFFRLKDQANIVVPCTDIYRFEGSKINDWRVYANISAFGLPSA